MTEIPEHLRKRAEEARAKAAAASGAAADADAPAAGGAEIGGPTLLRWYVLHVLMLPFVIVIFMAIHFWRVRKDGGISGPL